MKIVDTDILIDHFHGHRAAMDYLAQYFSTGGELALSVVTVTELLGGMRSGEEERTERLLHMFTVLDVTQAIGRQAAAYLRQYRRSHNLELGDALVAATAAHAGVELVTRNLKHYPMTDIRVSMPYERGSP